ncbi:MAG: 3-isopropylmalate dehydratase small subunit [Thermoanaerobaculia bacterium]
MSLPAIRRASGRARPLVGDDVDTDRIIPARFLVSVTFDGLGAHAFEDDRIAARTRGGTHPFDDPRFAGATLLVVNRNFGCGSSREHAPQALARGGFKAVVGESFSEIFFGNSLAIGLPCVTLPHEAIAMLQALVATDPATACSLDLETRTFAAGGAAFAVQMPENARRAFLTGHWDGTSLLLDHFEAVEELARRLPYVAGF